MMSSLGVLLAAFDFKGRERIAGLGLSRDEAVTDRCG